MASAKVPPVLHAAALSPMFLVSPVAVLRSVPSAVPPTAVRACCGRRTEDVVWDRYTAYVQRAMSVPHAVCAVARTHHHPLSAATAINTAWETRMAVSNDRPAGYG